MGPALIIVGKDKNMTTHLTTSQRTVLADGLQARRRALESELEAHQQGLSRVEHAREALAQDGDDAPQRVSDREVGMALSDIEQRELAAVIRAQQRVQDDNFGLCVDCARAIPFDRLSVEPYAERCVACESIHERNL